MKLIIDIPEEVREHIFNLANDGNEIPLGINAHMVKAIVNGTPIPDNATNGDVIKAMFSNAEYKHIKTMSGIDGMEVNGINGLYDNFGQWCARDIFFHDDWWNAPYERSTDADSD